MRSKEAYYWTDIAAENIPGTTRVPFAEIKSYFEDTKSLQGLDLGSGNGRSTMLLRQQLGGSVIAADLSYDGLQRTEATDFKVQASAVELPFRDNTFDYLVLCGVMTNLVASDPVDSNKIRKKVASEAHRVLRIGGLLVVSDFGQSNRYTNPSIDYERHSAITGELGTIAVYDPPNTKPFGEMTEEEFKAFMKERQAARFTHHYSSREMGQIFSQGGFPLDTISFKLEEGRRPTGRKIDALVVTALKA